MATDNVRSSKSVIPSATDLRVLAEAAMLFRATAVDDRGVGINHAMERPVPVVGVTRMRHICRQLRKEAKDDFETWWKSPFCDAVRRASYEAGHPFWMNAPFGAHMWLMAGFPGLTTASAIDARKDQP